MIPIAEYKSYRESHALTVWGRRSCERGCNEVWLSRETRSQIRNIAYLERICRRARPCTECRPGERLEKCTATSSDSVIVMQQFQFSKYTYILKSFTLLIIKMRNHIVFLDDFFFFHRRRCSVVPLLQIRNLF